MPRLYRFFTREIGLISSARIVEVVTDLVKIESINPGLVPGGSGEERIARHVLKFLAASGLKTQLQEVETGRFNAVGILKGSGTGRSLMLTGHLDTVGVAGMEDPFSARVEDGRLYARGAQDMKGGLAAAMVAVEELARGPRLAGDLIVAAVADEELESAGARRLIETGAMADAAIVMEPTGLEIATAHKGFAWAEVATRGRAAHGSRPEEGLDAIFFMGRVLREIERLQAGLNNGAAHPLLGHGSIHASLISGGQELSSYPAECRLSLERRFIPGETPATLDRELSQILSRLAQQDPQFRAQYKLGYAAQPLETAPESAVAQTLLLCAQRVIGSRSRLASQSFWTDAALFSEAGISSVLFGPGGAGLHGSVEYVNLDDVRLCAETLADCARAFCGS